MRTLFRSLPGLVFLMAALATSADARQRSPFSAVRFPDTTRVEVEVSDVWYQLVSIDGCPTKELVEHAQARHRAKWQKRIGEDLDQLFEELGRSIGDQVDLELHPPGGGDLVTLKGVATTVANRQRIRLSSQRGPQRSLAGDEELAPEVWQADLGHLGQILETRFAYLGMRDVSPAEEVEALLREHGDRPLTRAEFARAVNDLIAKFGDGHARVESLRDYLAEGYAPFLLRAADGGVVAFLPDRSGFVDAEYPYVDAIDGVKLEEWLRVAGQHITAGSPQLVERRALERLRWIQDVRRDGGFRVHDELALTCRNEDGQTTQVTLEVSAKRPIFGDWPRRETGWLEQGDVGYLRLGSMDRGLEGELGQALEEFADADALVIDVRGNGGGSRDALRFLGPRFLGPKNDPVVVNVGRYALPPDEKEDSTEGHLSDRFLWPRDWSPRAASTKGWSRDAKKAIDRFAKKFKPAGTLSARLSEPHYLVLDHPEEGVPRFEGLVLVLQDAGCFSATDIFLAGMKELPGVLTAGTPSSGGSARSQRHALPGSGLSFRCASMASWQVDGNFFDGHGVAPDIELKPRATDFLLDRGDSVLERALEEVDSKRASKAQRERK